MVLPKCNLSISLCHGDWYSAELFIIQLFISNCRFKFFAFYKDHAKTISIEPSTFIFNISFILENTFKREYDNKIYFETKTVTNDNLKQNFGAILII